jgi:hypothetical protein
MTRNRKILVGIAVVAAVFAAPASAHFGRFHPRPLAVLSGTGSSFGDSAATSSGSIVRGKLKGGTYDASLSTDWSAARTRTFNDVTVSCAPATGSLKLTNGTTTKTASLKGKTCSWTKSGETKYGFAGRDKTTHIAALFAEKGTTVRGLALKFRRHRG